MKLSELIKNLSSYKVYNFKNINIKGISCNSLKIKSGFIFVAIKGERYDGFKFIPEAISRGAKVIISEILPKERVLPDVTYIHTKNIRQAYSRICAEFYQNPSKDMKVVGVTGTNGKTTITYLLEKILKKEKRDSLLMGTINYR
ncbi:MAG: Mur ligase domain-containing protein, partial [Candidatus Omnitrophica bacterium]|nr:Mur ligase domain-containing protein [Candidatus Omnitrophota bacterium]